MIFAEFSNEMAMAAIAAVAAVFAGLYAMLTNRDKLRHDAEMVELRASNKHCIEEHQEAREAVGKLEIKLDKCEEQHEEVHAELGKVWAEIRGIKSGA